MKKNLYTEILRGDLTSLWKNKSPLLKDLELELTERCNLDCLHCCINLPSDDPNAKKKELSNGEVKDILKEAASLGCLRVIMTGGEPLLRRNFEELYVFARRLGLKVLLLTNGTLITPHLAELFTSIPPLEKIEISVYGMKKKSYEAVTRTSDSFEAAWRGINLLLEKKVPFVVKGAVLPPIMGEIEEFEAWASTIPWMDRQPSYCMFFNLRCRRDSEVKNNLIKKLRVSPEHGLKILTRKQWEYLEEMKAFCSKYISTPNGKLFLCGAGVGGGCVDAYGYFQPCMLLRHPDCIYDLKKGSLKDALLNFFPRIRETRATTPDYLRRCARCFLKSLCEQCPAKSWIEYGSLDTPVEYLCQIAHTQARYLGLLRNDEKAWQVTNWSERIRNFSGKHPRWEESSHAETSMCR